jgi:hypothetical protein
VTLTALPVTPVCLTILKPFSSKVNDLTHFLKSSKLRIEGRNLASNPAKL